MDILAVNELMHLTREERCDQARRIERGLVA
jgi:hypothetical protein